jgi:hypothetical protein
VGGLLRRPGISSVQTDALSDSVKFTVTTAAGTILSLYVHHRQMYISQLRNTIIG